MGRNPSSKESEELKKGPWSPEEDRKLLDHIGKNGVGNWQLVPKGAGLKRCGKSCRLRWANYLRPDIKRGAFSGEEEDKIIGLHQQFGNRWSKIAAELPGRTDNEVKNYYNTHIKKKLLRMGIDPMSHEPLPNLNHLLNNPIISPLDSALRLQANLTQIANFQLLQNIIQLLNSKTNNPFPLLQNNNVPMEFYNNNNVTSFDNFNVGPNEPPLLDPFSTASTTPNSFSVESAAFNLPSPVSNPIVLMNNHPSFNEQLSLPSLVPATPETSNSEQMFPKGVMQCDDDDFSAWEKVFCDEGNISLLDTIFQ